MFFIAIIFLVAIAISSVAAYFSIVGLGTLFAATFWGVVVMAASLEAGKVVITKWAHSNWNNPRSSKPFRYLICLFIASLMAVTSLGIYGYLSKGHLEQQAPVEGIQIQAQQLEVQIQQKKDENTRLEARLDQISKTTDKMLESSGRDGLRASKQQKSESQSISTEIQANNQAINDLNSKLVPLKVQSSGVEAKLGPIKYVAQLFGFTDPEVAVRIIICLIMIAFDPLALSLFIAGSISFADWQEERKKVRLSKQSSIDAPYSQELAEQLESFEADKAKWNDDLEVKNQTVDKRLENVQEVERAVVETLGNLEKFEERLLEEREYLDTWSENLAEQQQVINNWQPPTDDRDPKVKIIEMLEKHPEVISEIVHEVEALQPPKKYGL